MYNSLSPSHSETPFSLKPASLLLTLVPCAGYSCSALSRSSMTHCFEPVSLGSEASPWDCFLCWTVPSSSHSLHQLPDLLQLTAGSLQQLSGRAGQREGNRTLLSGWSMCTRLTPSYSILLLYSVFSASQVRKLSSKETVHSNTQ